MILNKIIDQGGWNRIPSDMRSHLCQVILSFLVIGVDGIQRIH